MHGLDPRTSCIYVFIRTQNTGFHGGGTTHRSVRIPLVVHDTLCRRISCACSGPRAMRERAGSIWNSRGKKVYGSWRGESVKRKISLGPPFPALLVFRIFADFFDAGSMHFSSRMDREKAMCLLFVKDVKLLEGTNLFRSRKSCGGNIIYTFGDIIGCWSLRAIFEKRFYMYNIGNIW